MKRMFLIAVLPLLLAACGDKAGTPTPTNKPTSTPAPTAKGGGNKEPGGHSHDGEKHDLGKQKAGAYEIALTLTGDVHWGGEGLFDAVISGGKLDGASVYAWFGDKDGKELGERSEMSATGKAGNYHGHVDPPEKKTEGVKLWVEVKDSAGARSKAAFTVDIEEEGHDDHDHDHADHKH